MSFSFRDRGRPRLSDRIRGKSGDELFNELKKEFDKDRKVFFDSPSSTSPTSNWGSSTGSTFPRAGHLFDDPLMRGHTDIRTHLEDLANRHPEFADHLRYPAWSNDTNRSNTWGRKRQHDNSAETSQPQTEPQPEQQEGAFQTAEEPGSLKGRTKDTLRNTVPDMGQKQQQETEDKESRGQRSWSAPPDNRTQQSEKPRFVSKIEIHPVNPDAPQSQSQGDATKPPMAPPKPQPQNQPQPQSQSQPKPQHKQSTVRHIPIFVEGRDEPVLPKNINIEPEFVQTQAPPQQHFSRPPPQPQFSSTQHTFHPQQPPPQQQQTHYEQPPQPSPAQQQQQSKPEPQVNPRDPLYKVGLVQKEVDELVPRIESFNGTSRTDKEYMILDELLTRELIKLDDIETEGKEEIRAARKNAIKTIQRCISVLENKVPLPGSEKKDEESMEVEQQSSEVANEMSKEENQEKEAKEHSNEVGKQEEQQDTNSPSASQEDRKEEESVTSGTNKETSSDKSPENTAA